MGSEKLKIFVTGDFCPLNRIEELARVKDFETILGDYRSVLAGNDLIITDMECPLTTNQDARLKTGPHQKAHPDCGLLLKTAGVGLVAMANNHIMDYGEQGVSDTLNVLKKNGIISIGIGLSDEEAARPFSFLKYGKKVAVLNYADNEFIVSPEKSYRCNPVNPVTMFEDVSSAKRTHDFIIVILHSGNEFYELPSPRTKSLFRFIVDLGADVVISHHTHAFSGYEIYKAKPIFYGLGNFIYDWPKKKDHHWYFGYSVKLIFSEKIDFELVPHKQGLDSPGIKQLSTEENEWFCVEIERLNNIISNDTMLEEEFMKYCHSVFPMYNAFIEPYFGKTIASLRKRKLFPNLQSRRKKLLLLNLVRCDSHRDVLVRMLSQFE